MPDDPRDPSLILGLLVALLLILSLVRLAGAQWATFDLTNNITAIQNGINQAIATAKQYEQGLLQYKQSAEQLAAMVRQVEQGAKNLTSMPKGLGVLDMLTVFEEKASTLLGGAQQLGFGLEQSAAQFDKLYGEVGKVTSPEARAALIQDMRKARMDTSRIAIQAQSVQTSFSALYAKLASLLGAANVADGAKAMLQINLQQSALAQQQAQVGLQLQAVRDRLDTMKQAEDMVLQELAAQRQRELWKGWIDRPIPKLGTGRGVVKPSDLDQR